MQPRPWIRLSYDLTERDPVPPGLPAMRVKWMTSIAGGDVSNTCEIRAGNHIGTHVDAPLHFSADGPSITDFDINSFYFTRPCVIDLPLNDGELILPVHLEPFEDLIRKCDLLLVRTGFGEARSADPDRYINNGPGFSEQGASYLARNFPDLRCLGMDTISLVAMRELEEGIRAHQALLGGGRRFLIIEDVDLNHDLTGIAEVLVLPLMIDGIDGSPCTVVAR